jgi:hypothetical protein
VQTLLSSFRKIAKSGYWPPRISLVIRSHGTARLPLEGFSWYLMFEYFAKISRRNSSYHYVIVHCLCCRSLFKRAVWMMKDHGRSLVRPTLVTRRLYGWQRNYVEVDLEVVSKGPRLLVSGPFFGNSILGDLYISFWVAVSSWIKK